MYREVKEELQEGTKQLFKEEWQTNE